MSLQLAPVICRPQQTIYFSPPVSASFFLTAVDFLCKAPMGKQGCPKGAGFMGRSEPGAEEECDFAEENHRTIIEL